MAPIGLRTPDVPDKTATFTNNGAPTSVTISDDAEINTMQFTAAAPAYSFTISSAFSIAGIDNSSAFAPSFILNNGAVVSFEIDNGSNTTFSGTISGSSSIGTLRVAGDVSFDEGSISSIPPARLDHRISNWRRISQEVTERFYDLLAADEAGRCPNRVQTRPWGDARSMSGLLPRADFRTFANASLKSATSRHRAIYAIKIFSRT